MSQSECKSEESKTCNTDPTGKYVISIEINEDTKIITILYTNKKTKEQYIIVLDENAVSRITGNMWDVIIFFQYLNDALYGYEKSSKIELKIHKIINNKHSSDKDNINLTFDSDEVEGAQKICALNVKIMYCADKFTKKTFEFDLPQRKVNDVDLLKLRLADKDEEILNLENEIQALKKQLNEKKWEGIVCKREEFAPQQNGAWQNITTLVMPQKQASFLVQWSTEHQLPNGSRIIHIRLMQGETSLTASTSWYIPCSNSTHYRPQSGFFTIDLNGDENDSQRTIAIQGYADSSYPHKYRFTTLIVREI